MIKIFSYIILIFFILTSTSFAVNEKEGISQNEQNSELNIKKAKLLEKHVYNLKQNLLILKDKYQIKGDYNIDQIQKELSIMIDSLHKIQSINIDKQISEKVTAEVIKRLKILTPKLKDILNLKKTEFEQNSIKIKDKYSKIADLLSNKIEKIVVALYKPIKNKQNYSLKDSKVIKHLKNLLKENKKLKDFKNESFKEESEMKIVLLNILRNIQKEISGLKTILN